jgi:hypothetical protein
VNLVTLSKLARAAIDANPLFAFALNAARRLFMLKVEA